MRLLRLFRVAVHLLHGALILRFNYDQHSADQRADLRARWASGVLRHFGLQLDVHGLPQASVLLASSTSWSWKRSLLRRLWPNRKFPIGR